MYIPCFIYNFWNKKAVIKYIGVENSVTFMPESSLMVLLLEQIFLYFCFILPSIYTGKDVINQPRQLWSLTAAHIMQFSLFYLQNLN